jgi:hypothetical protein
MTYRKDPAREREHAKWVLANRDYLLRSPIPMVAWESALHWAHFLEDDLPFSIDHSRFSTDTLSDDQALELCLFLEKEHSTIGNEPPLLRRLQARLSRGRFST